MLENFNAFSKLANLDFDIPLPHILLPLALSFVTFQQIAFLFDCYKRTKGELNENLHIDFVDYALFISFFPQLIAGPIVHHREMMPQFAKMGNSPLGMQFRTCEKFWESTDSSLVLSQNFSQTQKPYRKYFDCDSPCESATNQTQNKNNPSLRGKAEAIQNNNVDCHDSTHCVESRNDEVKSIINYEFLAKGIFIFSIGLFKKVFIADSFAKWANAGFGVVEKGGVLNIAESWATSLSYTFQLYFDFSGYCDMAMGFALMFGIVLPLNFDSPYKSLNIAEFWRRWHITLGRFLRECLYIPLGGNRGKSNSSLTQSSREIEKSLLDRQQVLSHADFSAQPTNLTQDTRIANDSQKQSYITKILTLRNLFIVAFLSGIWHGAGWGFVIWGILHGVAMVIHRIYGWIHQSLNQTNALIKFMQTKSYKILCWFLTFNFINLTWIFFRAENLNGAVNLVKGMFGVANVEFPHKWSKIFSTLQGGTNEILIWIVCAIVVCVACINSNRIMQNAKILHFIIAGFAFALCIFTMLSSTTYKAPFLYFNF